MYYRHNRRMSGFTLVELAIVLGVAGVLFGGLWRLLSTSNQQMRDQATANQHAQLIAAVGAYLQSSGQLAWPTTGGGQAFLGNMAPNPGVLALPTVAAGPTAACAANIPANPGLCNFLPPGFNVNTSLNPYGQTYSVRVLKDATVAPNPPASYSFMIMTTLGDVITDTSGGRISAMIGGDGGFLYNTATCGTPLSLLNACGSYGAWLAPPAATYGFAAAPVGHVASRTYYSSSQNTTDLWLARKPVTGDNTRAYNTMQLLPVATPLYLGGNDIVFNDFGNAHPGGTMQLGTSGIISGVGNAAANPVINMSGNMLGIGNYLINLQQNGSACTTNTGGAFVLGILVLTEDAACKQLMYANGDVSVIGKLNAYSFFASTFVYQSSDIRLKEDVKPLSNSLEGVMKLKPVSFVFKENHKKSMGVIAQDLEKIYPELVENDGKTGYKSVSYTGLIAPLIAAVQELKKENDALRAQISAEVVRREKMELDIKEFRKK